MRRDGSSRQHEPQEKKCSRTKAVYTEAFTYFVVVFVAPLSLAEGGRMDPLQIGLLLLPGAVFFGANADAVVGRVVGRANPYFVAAALAGGVPLPGPRPRVGGGPQREGG